MRIAAIFLGLAMTLTSSLALGDAGGIAIEILNDEDLVNSLYRSSLPSRVPQPELSCGVAKYQETVSCQNIVVKNGSTERVQIEIQVVGSNFEEFPGEPFGHLDFGPPPAPPKIGPCAETLDPQKSCYRHIEFMPGECGVSIGRVEVRITGSSTPTTGSYALTGIAECTPDLEAADRVRKTHLDELMRISHVARVTLDNSGDNIAIDVEVAHEEDIPKVEREVPPRLEGYRVEVTEKLEDGWAL